MSLMSKSGIVNKVEPSDTRYVDAHAKKNSIFPGILLILLKFQVYFEVVNPYREVLDPSHQQEILVPIS